MLCASTGCKDKGDAGKSIEQRCEQLAKACGDNDKHVQKIVEGCKQAAKPPADSCGPKTIAVFDCYEKEVCGKADKVWSFDDLHVLADRNKKCVAERAAADACAGKK